MDDDAKLKILLYSIVLLSAVVIIGIWESFIEPVAVFIIGTIDIG